MAQKIESSQLYQATSTYNGEQIVWDFKVDYIGVFNSQEATDSLQSSDWNYKVYVKTNSATVANFADYDGLTWKFYKYTPNPSWADGSVEIAYKPIGSEWTLLYDKDDWITHNDYVLSGLNKFRITVQAPEHDIFKEWTDSGTWYDVEIRSTFESEQATVHNSQIVGNDWYCHKTEKSNIYISNGNIKDTVTITLVNSDTSLAHDVYYYPTEEITDSNKILIGSTKTTDYEIKWQIPESLYEFIPNSRSGTGVIYVRTYEEDIDGNWVYVKAGSASDLQTFTYYAVEEDCKPVCSPKIIDSNEETIELTGDNNKLIRYKSHAAYSTNATAKYYSSIVSVEVTNGSQTLNTETGVFQNFANDYFIFQVTDSRGYSTILSYTPNIIPYVNLSCIADAEAPTADGDLNFTIYGNYFSGSFGAAANTLRVFYRLKQISQTTGEGAFSSWVEVPFELGTNKYTAAVSIGDIDYRNTFIIEAYAVDVFGVIYSDEEATSALPIFDWGINDFNMNCDMTVYGTLTVNGNVIATGTVNGQGTDVSSYEIHYGTCQTDGNMEAKLVTCPTFTTLATGSSIRVKFAYANTAANVVMNVNNTGVVSVKKNDEESDLTNAWKKGAVRDFVYDGTNWIIVCYD